MKDVKVVIGASFGDEGKGLMTDYFAGKAKEEGKSCLVVCGNGGAQRGHTVRVNYDGNRPEGEKTVRHVFHHFGSGTLEGADTYLPHFFILNPILLVTEYEQLIDEIKMIIGEDIVHFPKVYLHPECIVSTPFDMLLNQIIEESRGNGRHGSCGMGIWETLVRNGINFGEMMEMDDYELIYYLKYECKEYMWNRLRKLGIDVISEKWLEIIEDDGILEHYIEDFRIMKSICELADVEIFDDYDLVIFENGQGLLLDRCRREYGSNTTPSNTGLRNPAALLREFEVWKKSQSEIRAEKQIEKPAEKREEAGRTGNSLIDVEVCYVSRTYLTRHGAGRFDEQCNKEEINPDMEDRTNVPNPHQGTMRYGFLDINALLKRIKEDFDSERLPEGYKSVLRLAVTHINEYENEVMKRADYMSDGESREDIYIC